MKYLSKDAINSSGTKTRVLREVQYMRMLKHAHIVKLSVASVCVLSVQLTHEH